MTHFLQAGDICGVQEQDKTPEPLLLVPAATRLPKKQGLIFAARFPKREMYGENQASLPRISQSSTG